MAKTNPGQKKPTSIWLEAEMDGGGSDLRKLFNCFNCKMPVIQYIGEVITIVPGKTPYSPGTILKCRGNVRMEDSSYERCGMEYIFQGVVYTKNPEMT